MRSHFLLDGRELRLGQGEVGTDVVVQFFGYFFGNLVFGFCLYVQNFFFEGKDILFKLEKFVSSFFLNRYTIPAVSNNSSVRVVA